MENFFKCPKCGDLSYENFIPNIGRHLLCPYCKTKFSFEPKHLIGKGTKLGLVKRYSEVELNQLFSTTFKNTEAPVAEEPQEETSPEPPKAEAVEVAVSELPKEDTTSIVETANEPAKEATSPDPQEAEAVEVAVAELPKEDTAFILETAKEPAQETTSSKPEDADVVNVSVAELPKEEPTSTTETAPEPVQEETSPEPPKAQAVDVAVAELPKQDSAFIVETAKEPAQETTSSEPEGTDVLNVSASELPKEEPTSITETAPEPVQEETSPEPPKAQAVDVAVAELPKEVITCAVENIKGSTYKEKSKIDSLPKIAEIKPHSIYPTCKPAVKTIDRNLRCITENEMIPKSKESLKISDAEIMPLDIVPPPLEIKPTPNKKNKMKKVLSFATLLVLLSVGSVVYVIIRDYPALTVRKSADVSVSQTIIDHKLPKLLTSYNHSGKPELVITKVWRERNTSEGVTLQDYWMPQIYWCKVIDKKQEQEKALWRKVADKLIAMLRFMSFDERGAFLLTERSYVEDNEVLPGDYIYLGSLRLTVHVEGQGTGVWEFPGYVDQSMPFEKLNSILRLKEKEMIEIVRQMMYSTTTPEESYKVKQVERGAMRRETMQPWINLSCDVTLEYIGKGINAR